VKGIPQIRSAAQKQDETESAESKKKIKGTQFCLKHYEL